MTKIKEMIINSPRMQLIRTDDSVSFVIKCDSKYESVVLFYDVLERLNDGEMIQFQGKFELQK